MLTSLSQTSALVLVCDKNTSYKSPKAKQFISHLDLSKGQEMYNKIQHLRPHIDEVIPNRKFLIHNYLRKILKKYPPPFQVLSLACGWDPILIKMSEEFPYHSFFGVDNESVKVQEKLVKQIMPKSPIYYLQVDITQTKQLLNLLQNKGWNNKHPTFLIVEGISYYIQKNIFWKSLSTLQKNLQSDCFICGDFLIDWKKQKVSDISEKLAFTIFNMIKITCSQDYYTYTSKSIENHLKEMNFSDIQFFTQGEIQKQRTKDIKPWEQKQDGHICLFTAQIKS